MVVFVGNQHNDDGGASNLSKELYRQSKTMGGLGVDKRVGYKITFTSSLNLIFTLLPRKEGDVSKFYGYPATCLQLHRKVAGKAVEGFALRAHRCQCGGFNPGLFPD